MADLNDRQRIVGRAIVLRGDDIDTDRIIPARFLKAVTFVGLETHLFADERTAIRTRGGVHPFDDPARRDAAVLLVNGNFGCGSSREHAPQALRRRGIRAVVGESFAEIFFSNSLTIGLPCVTASAEEMTRLMAAADDPAVGVDVDLTTLRARAGAVDVAIALPEAARHAFLTGEWDATGLLLRDYEEVAAVERRLRY